MTQTVFSLVDLFRYSKKSPMLAKEEETHVPTDQTDARQQFNKLCILFFSTVMSDKSNFLD